jgi:hypothetical protein
VAEVNIENESFDVKNNFNGDRWDILPAFFDCPELTYQLKAVCSASLQSNELH